MLNKKHYARNNLIAATNDIDDLEGQGQINGTLEEDNLSSDSTDELETNGKNTEDYDELNANSNSIVDGSQINRNGVVIDLAW